VSRAFYIFCERELCDEQFNHGPDHDAGTIDPTRGTMQGLATSGSRCLHSIMPIVLEPTHVTLPAECNLPETCYVAGDGRVMDLPTNHTLVVGDSMARQFLMTCVHLNRRGRLAPPVLDFDGHNDWAYELEGQNASGVTDRLRALRRTRRQLVAPAPSSLIMSFQHCTSAINLTRPAYDHRLRPRTIIVFAPVYWHATGHCGNRTWSVEQWAWDLLDRVKTTRPPDFRGLVHLVIPPLDNVQNGVGVARALDAIVRPMWTMGSIYRMANGSSTWSREKRAYTNWHAVCSVAFIRNGSLHMHGTQDGRCTESANLDLLTRMSSVVVNI
jgi:hypothetical protein